MKLPKYIKDNPEKDDLFQIHSQIANTIKKIIDDEDVTNQPFHFGLFGDWGSGKSFVIKQLKKQIKPTENIVLIELDVWKYVDSSLYRSILFDLEAELKFQANIHKSNTVLHDKFKNGFKDKEGFSLKENLNYSNEIEIENKKKTSIFKNLYKTIKAHWILTILIALIVVVGYISGMPKVNKDNLILKFVHDIVKPLNGYFTIIGLLGGVKFIEEYYKLIFDSLQSKPRTKILSSSPTFAQDQFENLFLQMVTQASGNGKQKVVIVFDNIDRCENELIYHILSGLKTFLSTPNCFFIIPCDDNALRKYWSETNTSEGYFDKIFTSYIRIPFLESKKQLHFIEEYIKECGFDLNDVDKRKVTQILFFAYGGKTPREILRFFNDIVSYFRLAFEIDPKEESILKNKSMFFFMMVVKQKWPDWEKLFVQKPSLFPELKENNKMVQTILGEGYTEDGFLIFLNNCRDWVDFSIDLGNYVFLDKNSNSSELSAFLKIESNELFELNQSLILAIEQELISNQKYHDYHNLLDKYILKFAKFWFDKYDLGLKNHFTSTYFRLLEGFLEITKGKIDTFHFDFIIKHSILDFIEKNNKVKSLSLLLSQLSFMEFNKQNEFYFEYFKQHVEPNYFKVYFFTQEANPDLNYLLLIDPLKAKMFVGEVYLMLIEKQFNLDLTETEVKLLHWVEITDFNLVLNQLETLINLRNPNLQMAISRDPKKYSLLFRNLHPKFFQNQTIINISTALLHNISRQIPLQNTTPNYFWGFINFASSKSDLAIFGTIKSDVKFWKKIIADSNNREWEISFTNSFKIEFFIDVFSKTNLWYAFYEKVESAFLNKHLNKFIEFDNPEQVLNLMHYTFTSYKTKNLIVECENIQHSLLNEIILPNLELYIESGLSIEVHFVSNNNKSKFINSVKSLFSDVQWISENVEKLKSPNLKDWIISKNYFKIKALKELLNEE